jgi:hypothetical protein
MVGGTILYDGNCCSRSLSKPPRVCLSEKKKCTTLTVTMVWWYPTVTATLLHTSHITLSLSLSQSIAAIHQTNVHKTEALNIDVTITVSTILPHGIWYICTSSIPYICSRWKKGLLVHTRSTVDRRKYMYGMVVGMYIEYVFVGRHHEP